LKPLAIQKPHAAMPISHTHSPGIQHQKPGSHPDSCYSIRTLSYLAVTLDNINCPSLQVGGVEDHVHLFFGLSRTKSIAEVVETVKTSSSKWIKTKGAEFAHFQWQAGYAALSADEFGEDAVVHYIKSQAEHHKKVTFQDEYRALLERYKIPYDERYVWD
jgi:putative transposase